MSVFVRMLTASGIALAALAAGPANAATLIEQDLGTGTTSFISSGRIKVYDDFKLAAASTIQSITFWSDTFLGGERNFEISFWSTTDDRRWPNVEVAPLYKVNVISDGQQLSRFIAKHDVTLATPVNLLAGRYFISIYGASYFQWVTSSSLESGIHQLPLTAVINQNDGDRFYHEGNAAFRLGGEVVPAAAVPEPATWALMMAGFGLVGTAMRRRAVRAIAA